MTAATGGRGRWAAVGWSIAFLALCWIVTGILVFGFGYLATGSPRSVAAWVSTASGGVILAQGLALMLAALLATWVIGGKVLHLTLADLRWKAAGRLVPGAAFGFLAGALAAAAALLLAVPLAHARWLPDSGGALAYGGSVVRTAAVLAPAALAEELAFRGLPLVLLAAAFGRSTALMFVAVLFALGHATNPQVTGLALGNIALAGIFLGLAFYAPGGLWTAFGAHFGWNLTLAALDAPVSGLPFRIPLIDFSAGGPGWLSGGAFGPEGGLTATLALALGCVILARRTGKETA